MITFPDGIDRMTRQKIRRQYVSLKYQQDDRDNCGLSILIPDGPCALTITTKRIARAYKAVLGDICGMPLIEDVRAISGRI